MPSLPNSRTFIARGLNATVRLARAGVTILALLVSLPAMAQEPNTAKPQLLLKELVHGMPRSEQQEVRVLTANFKPGDKTVFHTHRFPVTVYILEGCIHTGTRGA